uniref:Ig-like domain-containing protein n=1 Tax=Anopheles maculatus TaxID=74869 RepID=A0A182SKS5_9DIPT
MRRADAKCIFNKLPYFLSLFPLPYCPVQSVNFVVVCLIGAIVRSSNRTNFLRKRSIIDPGTFNYRPTTTHYATGQHFFLQEPVTEINGGPDLFINKGSTINLTCIVKYAPEPPPAVVWKHNRDDINFDSPRGGISLVTEKGILTTSRLLVQKAIPSDSGLYTCEPSNANPASVRVHILN